MLKARRVRARVAAFFFAAVFLFSSCGFHVSGYPVQIYFPDRNALFLVPVTRFISSPPTPGLLLGEMEKGPLDRQHLLPAFPKGISAEVETARDVIRVNLVISPHHGRWPIMMVPAILATFQQLPQYRVVQFLKNGAGEALTGEEELASESLSDFTINDNWRLSDPRYITGESRKVVVYYKLAGTFYLVPVTLRISPAKSVEEGALEALEDNPRLSWILRSPLPSGSEVYSISRPAPDIIEMSVKLAGTSRENALAERALALTFTTLPGVKFVRIRHGNGLFSWRPLQKKPESVNIEEGHGD